jgi:hypothetical protein
MIEAKCDHGSEPPVTTWGNSLTPQGRALARGHEGSLSPGAGVHSPGAVPVIQARAIPRAGIVPVATHGDAGFVTVVSKRMFSLSLALSLSHALSHAAPSEAAHELPRGARQACLGSRRCW